MESSKSQQPSSRCSHGDFSGRRSRASRESGSAETEAALTQVASRAMRARIDGAMAQSDLGMTRRLFDGYADGMMPADGSFKLR